MKKYLSPFALLALSQSIFAQQVPPGFGGQAQQLPPALIPEKTVPRVDVNSGAAPSAVAAPDSVKIMVNTLRVTGAQAYSEAELLAVAGFMPGSELSLADLRGMAARIADHYHRNGFFVAQAYLPAQDIQDGIVTIAVMDGRLGQVTLNNQSKVSDALAYQLLGDLHSGDPVVSSALEGPLLLLSDLPGVVVKSTLVPGAAPGTLDLNVDLTPGRSVHGSVDADNAGNRYTGENRIGATIHLNEPLGLGDVASLRVLTSGPGLNYARASYQLQVGKGSVGAAYSYLHYALGREFESLQAKGTAQTASVFSSYPLVRSRNNNLYAGLTLEAKAFQDRVDSIPSVADKRAQVLTASLYGDQRDNLGGGGLSSYSLALSGGNIDQQTPAVQANDALTAKSNGHFNKLAFNAGRQQRVTDALSLSATLHGQLATKNLDVSEKMELGGMYAVRAYPEGEAYADEGSVLNLEARVQLPQFSPNMSGRVQLIGFADVGRVTLNKAPWVPGSNTRTLSGAGIGIHWSETDNFMVRAYYAVKLGDEVATSAPDASGRFWIQAVKYF